MKKLIILLTILIFFGACNGQKESKNMIKSEEIVFFEYEDNKNLVRRNFIGYDEFNTFDINGKFKERSIIIWDDTTQKDEIKLIEKHYYKDTLLLKGEKFSYISGEKYEVIENKFNEKKQLVKTFIRSFDDEKEVFKKNKSFYKIYEYERNSRKAKVYEYDEATHDFKLTFTEVKTFDEKNVLKEEKFIDSNNEVYEINHFVYNKDKKISEKTTQLRFPSKINYSYNLKKDVERYTYINGNYKSETLYTYKYDDKGNWIEKTETSDKEKYLIKRKLEYY